MGMWSELWLWVRDQFDPESRGFDREFGTATAWYDLGNYEPTPPSVVNAILERVEDPERYAFVDLGCGKGRVVLLAAGRPFRAVLGVERRWMLVQRAQNNLRNYLGPIVVAPEVRRADAVSFAPPDGPLMLFLYNPFPPDVVRAVLSRFTDRELLVASVNPPTPPFFAELGFTRLHEVPHSSDDRRWVLVHRPVRAPTLEGDTWPAS